MEKTSILHRAVAGAFTVLAVFLINCGSSGGGGTCLSTDPTCNGGGGGTTYTVPADVPAQPRPGDVYTENDTIPCTLPKDLRTEPPNNTLEWQYWLHGFRADSIRLICTNLMGQGTPLVFKYKLAGNSVKLPEGDTYFVRHLARRQNAGQVEAWKDVDFDIVPAE